MTPYELSNSIKVTTFKNENKFSPSLWGINFIIRQECLETILPNVNLDSVYIKIDITPGDVPWYKWVFVRLSNGAERGYHKMKRNYTSKSVSKVFRAKDLSIQPMGTMKEWFIIERIPECKSFKFKLSGIERNMTKPMIPSVLTPINKASNVEPKMTNGDYFGHTLMDPFKSDTVWMPDGIKITKDRKPSHRYKNRSYLKVKMSNEFINTMTGIGYFDQYNNKQDIRLDLYDLGDGRIRLNFTPNGHYKATYKTPKFGDNWTFSFPALKNGFTKEQYKNFSDTTLNPHLKINLNSCDAIGYPVTGKYRKIGTRNLKKQVKTIPQIVPVETLAIKKDTGSITSLNTGISIINTSYEDMIRDFRTDSYRKGPTVKYPFKQMDVGQSFILKQDNMTPICKSSIKKTIRHVTQLCYKQNVISNNTKLFKFIIKDRDTSDFYVQIYRVK